jgi:hypothetical protein
MGFWIHSSWILNLRRWDRNVPKESPLHSASWPRKSQSIMMCHSLFLWGQKHPPPEVTSRHVLIYFALIWISPTSRCPSFRMAGLAESPSNLGYVDVRTLQNSLFQKGNTTARWQMWSRASGVRSVSQWPCAQFVGTRTLNSVTESRKIHLNVHALSSCPRILSLSFWRPMFVYTVKWSSYITEPGVSTTNSVDEVEENISLNKAQ